MGVAATLVMWSRPSPPHRGSTCNLVSIDPAVSEEMLFENVDEADADNANEGQRTIICPLSSPETFGSGELKNVKCDLAF